MIYGKPPIFLDDFKFDLQEVMYYLYLPIFMRGHHGRNGELRVPPNLEVCMPLINCCFLYCNTVLMKKYDYMYISARKGWATKDNPLNRPGWHADGFGTDDVNMVWWTGPGTRFALQPFEGIEADHCRSLEQFDEQVRPECIHTYPEKKLFVIHPDVVHATPIIEVPCMRQYVKISLSNNRYNLENNSHNYLFDYEWELHSRDVVRNDTARAQLDYYDGAK